MVKLWLIRHGQTIYNKLQHEWTDSGNSLDHAQFRWDRTYWDCPLSDIGIQQAQSKIHEAHALNLSKVVVSPLKRALQTCDILFRNHPNTPEIIVHPIFTELLHNSHDISTFSGDPFPEYSHFNWSYMPDKFFAPLILKNIHTQELIELQSEEARTRLLQIMSDINPGIVESEHELYDRTRQAQSFLKNLDENAAVVTHSSFITYFLGQLDEDGNFINLRRYRNLDIIEHELIN